MTSFKINTDEINISAFDGLNEKDTVHLYNIAKILKLKTFEVIFKEDIVDETLYILISGSIKLYNSAKKHQIEIILSHKNSFIDETAFIKNKKRLFSCFALEPSTVMAISEKDLDLLPQHIKLNLLKNLNNSNALNSLSLRYQIAETNDIISYLSSYIKQLSNERSDLCEKSEIIQNTLKKFPRLPVYAMKLTELLLEENTSIKEIVDLAKTEPSLIADTLKTINSAYYNLTYKVSDFQHAAMLLGFNKIYQIAIDSSISNLMPETQEFRLLRSHSLLTAALGVEIAMHCMIQKPLIMNTIGMLHNIGKNVVILLNKEQPYLSILFNMLDDAKLASLLLREWNIPDKVHHSIEYYHLPEFVSPEEITLEYRDLVSTLYLARLIQNLLEKKKESEIRTPFLDRYLKTLNIKKSFQGFTKEILSSLKKKADTFPEDIRVLLS